MADDRYVSFGERVGAVLALELARDEVTHSFRRAVWNFVRPRFAQSYDRSPDVSTSGFWLRMAADKRWDMDQHRTSSHDVCALVMKEWLLDPKESAWHEVYEFLDGFPRWANFRGESRDAWERQVNQFLWHERSPFRFVNHQLAPITSEQEQAEVAEAASKDGKYGRAANHLQKALTKFSTRPSPDYENACKEAASAVEAALNIANGKHLAVGDAVREFAKAHSVHFALVESANKLFGYASDRDGVRHASKGTSTPVDFDEAKLVIVAASAWVNFIAAKAP